MSPVVRVASFIAQSVAIGLALAFVVVLVRPELIGRASTSAASAASYAEAVAASAAAVANIYTERVYNVPRNGLPAEGARHGRSAPASSSIAQGYVVTNWHVIRDADEIRVQLADGRVAVPQLVGKDPETELALLKIDLPDLPEIRLGRSDTLEVGDVVLAIGNSLGLSQTVTMGIVSATGRGARRSRRSRTSFRRTPRSTSATRAARSSTRAASSSASTRPSSAGPTTGRCRKASASRFP